MRIWLISSSMLLVFSCQSHSSKQSSSESAAATLPKTSATSDTLCFQQILKRDSTTLRLIVNGAQASGYLDINPFEKDRARGSFQGKITGNKIRADWNRSGEGVTQFYSLDLTLNAIAISWHEGERVKKQGVWVLKQPTRGYAYVLNKVESRAYRMLLMF